MKKIALSCLIASLCLSVKAQKLEKPEIDKFTGDTTIRTKEEVLQNKFSLIAHYLSCTAIKLSGHYMLRMHMVEGLNIIFSTTKGDKIDLKLKSGKIVELLTPLSQTSSISYNSYGAAASASILYDLTDEDIADLKAEKVSIIRIITSKAPFDYEISDGKSDVIKKQLELITKSSK